MLTAGIFLKEISVKCFIWKLIVAIFLYNLKKVNLKSMGTAKTSDHNKSNILGK